MDEKLMECPDCWYKVSPRAEWCPGCGCKLQYTYTEQLAKRQMTATKVVVTIIVLLIGGCVAISMLSGG